MMSNPVQRVPVVTHPWAIIVSSVPEKTSVVPGMWAPDIYTIHVMFSVIAVG